MKKKADKVKGPVLKDTVAIKETILNIVSDRLDTAEVKACILAIRSDLEGFIRSDPFFLTTYEPYPCPKGAPEVVHLMCDAAKQAGVGPMAAVAGTISYLVARHMLETGSTWAVVENGGDIAIKINEPYHIGIFAGDSPVKDLGLRLEPRKDIFGVCTSSGTWGHSVSLGCSDAACVVAKDPVLADACATLLGNQVQSRDPTEKEMDSYFKCLKGIKGVNGALIVVGEKIGMWGKLPKLVRTKNPDVA